MLEASSRVDARHRHAELVEQIDRARVRLLRARRADRWPTREYDRLMRELQALEEEYPELRTPGLADPEGRRHLLHRVHRGRPPRADAEPGQRLLRRGARGLGGRGSSGTRAPPTVHYLCELKVDGWRSTCSTRTAGWSGRHPRRRPHRRGRHAQRPHHRRRPDAGSTGDDVPGPARGPRRGLLPGRGASRSSTRGWSRPARRRSPTRATPPPGRCGRRTRGSPRPRPLRMVVHGIGAREGFDADRAVRGLRRAARLGPAGQRPVRGRRRPGRRAGATSTTTASTGTTSSTRSTAWWSRSTRSRVQRRLGLDLPGAALGDRVQVPAGGGQPPSCSTSGSTSAAPAGSRRSA